MNNIFITLCMGLVLLCAGKAMAQDEHLDAGRPDIYGPAGVMGSHYHPKGGWMLSYMYMPMRMSGTISGSSDISTEEVLQRYMAAPQNMFMQMHMLGIMYSPLDQVTLMVMGNYMINSMDLKSRMGKNFTTRSQGIGDISITALVKLLTFKRNSIHANAGVYVPAGNLDQRDNTPMMEDAQLAYPMQLGSGTWDPFIGATYIGQGGSLGWGLQSLFVFRPGYNAEGYNLGNRWSSSGWVSFTFSDRVSSSVRVSYTDQARIAGRDEDMNPMMMPLFDPRNSDRSQVDLLGGLNIFLLPKESNQLLLSVEAGLPLYQHANGVQMKNTFSGQVALRYSFGNHDHHHEHHHHEEY